MPRERDSEVEENRRRRREIRQNRGEIPGLDQEDPPGGGETNYNYGDPGIYGDPNYQYQWGDEFNNPGPEPPRDSPEWPAWKAQAKAWRNFIGQRQNAVDTLISMGYEPEQLGIKPIKEQGLAGWNRLNSRTGSGGGTAGWEYNWATGMKRNIATSDVTARDRWYPISAQERSDYAQNTNYIGILRNRQRDWMRGADLTFDAATGRYSDGENQLDEYGAYLDAQGRRTGRSYGDEHARTLFSNRRGAEGTGTGTPTASFQAPSFGTLVGQAGLGSSPVSQGQNQNQNQNQSQGQGQLNPLTGTPLQSSQMTGSSIPGMEDYYNSGNTAIGRNPYERRTGRRRAVRATGWGQTSFGA